MGFFQKSNYTDFTEKNVSEIRSIYTSCIEQFSAGIRVSKEFEDRYLAIISTPKANLEAFLREELLLANTLYDVIEKKTMEERSKQMELEKQKKNYFQNIYNEFENRIKKYPEFGCIPEDSELDRLIGAINQFYEINWIRLEDFFRKKYKIESRNPLQEIAIKLYDFIPKRTEKLPYILVYLKEGMRKNEDEKELEKYKQKVLKETGLFLNKLLAKLSHEVKNHYFSIDMEKVLLQQSQKKIEDILLDFRISAFSD